MNWLLLRLAERLRFCKFQDMCSYNQPTWLPTQSCLCSVYRQNSLVIYYHPSSTTRIFLITNHQPLFHICITLPVESAPFFNPSTAFCSLSYALYKSTFYLVNYFLPFTFTLYARAGAAVANACAYHGLVGRAWRMETVRDRDLGPKDHQ